MKQYYILLVEDEPKMSVYIKMGLEENNYIVDVAFDGRTAVEKAIENKYNAIILDIGLPELNGYEACRIMRQKKPKLPILMLSAHSKMEDKLAGFEAGADDYMTKPFDFNELLARLKALLYRAEPTAEDINSIKVADLEINLDSKEVKRANIRVELTAKEFNLLLYLAQHKNKVVSRHELLEKIWGISFEPGTNVIDVYINFLRKKIDLPSYIKLIHTYVGMGYILKENVSAD